MASCWASHALLVAYCLCVIGITSINGFASRSSKATTASLAAVRHPQAEDDKENEWRMQSSPVDSERRPRRTGVFLRDDNSLEKQWEEWGIEYCLTEPTCPDTFDSVTDAARFAIVGTLFGKQKMDPNVASNAMTSTVYGYRPVRTPLDVGRIGVEIDGANYLFPPGSRRSNPDAAVRHAALMLASKLSQRPWKGDEQDLTDDGKKVPSHRPVAVYFNTVRQALAASQELQLMKRTEVDGGKAKKKTNRYDHISILCLGQDDDLPKKMKRPKKGYKKVSKGRVDPTRGLILVVQPTDYNDEHRPPGPAVGAAATLQQLVARAAVEELPAIVISPRFLKQQEDEDGPGWEQSGYQQSAMYGGAEPPRGPTPWVMRDFTPPAFSWVGCALSLTDPTQPQSSRLASGNLRVALTQSVMQEGHSWHMFAAKDTVVVSDGSKQQSYEPKVSTCYKYLASTKTSSGRPTKNIIRRILSEY